jgi:hypothetical protein
MVVELHITAVTRNLWMLMYENMFMLDKTVDSRTSWELCSKT